MCLILNTGIPVFILLLFVQLVQTTYNFLDVVNYAIITTTSVPTSMPTSNWFMERDVYMLRRMIIIIIYPVKLEFDERNIFISYSIIASK